ncbi:MAG: hypothetical protein PHS49_03465 [Candidatus Gracilibacteria bacterium]|nr:hypothetical protein [Candidatus Gracilibacteria bacterium]
MKGKIFLILFVFIVVVDTTNAGDLNSGIIEINTNDNYRYENVKNDDDDDKIEKSDKNNYGKDDKSANKNGKLINEKKLLKKEIQNRRKLHRNLLSMYNDGFEQKYLDMITNNSLHISNLENHFRVKYKT